MPDFSIAAISDRSISDDSQTVTLTLTDAQGERIALILPHRLANELRDSITALNDEVMARQATQAEGMKTGAYRRYSTVDLKVDAMGSAVLMDFDPGTPLRVAIAAPLDDAQQLSEGIATLVERARALGRTQRPQ